MDDGAWGSVAGHIAFCFLRSGLALGGFVRISPFCILPSAFAPAWLCPAFQGEAHPKPIRNLNPSAPFPLPWGALPPVLYRPGPTLYP